MSDKVSWSDKAIAVFIFAIEAHNASANSKNVLIQAGSAAGGAMLLSFAVESPIKGLLEAKGRPILQELRTHSVHKLYSNLSRATREKASKVYVSLIKAETDTRILGTATNSLSGCLKAHDRAFTNWRYNIVGAGRFYPIAMLYACVSLLTLLRPDQRFTVGSRSSPFSEILNGKPRRRE